MLTGRYVFIDIGAGETKIIEALIQRHTITLLNSAEMRDMSLFVSDEGVIRQTEGFCESLKHTLAEAGITTKKAIVCSSVFSFLTKDITAEYLTVKNCAAHFEKDYFKLSGYSVVHDWHHMGDVMVDDIVQQKLYLTSGPTDVLKNFVREMRRIAGITVVSIESPLTARSNLRNIYTSTYDLPCVGLVDLGRDEAHCEIFKNGAIVHCAEIQSAIFKTSEILAGKLNIPLPKINNILYNIGLVKSGKNDSALASEGISPAEYYSTLEALCEDFVNELQAHLSEVSISKNLENVQMVFMGGYMAMPGIAEFIQKLYTFTPSRIFIVGTAVSMMDICITSNLNCRLSAKYATCIGLTLKNCNSSVHMVNLLPNKKEGEQTDWGEFGLKLISIAKFIVPSAAILAVGIGIYHVLATSRTEPPIVNIESDRMQQDILSYFAQSEITTEYGTAGVSITPIIFDEIDSAEYVYTSLNEDIVTVSEEGILTTTGVGSTLVAIHADILHGGLQDTLDCAVSVKVEKGTPSISADDIFMQLTEGEREIEASTRSDGKISYTASDTRVVEVIDNKVYPKSSGTAHIVVSVDETEHYLAGSGTITVSVLQDRIGENVEIVDFSSLLDPQFGTSVPLRLAVAGKSNREIPFIIYCKSDDINVMLYQSTVRIIPGSVTSVDFDVDLGMRTGNVILQAVIADTLDETSETNAFELPLTILPPTVAVSITDKPQSIHPGKAIMVGYEILSNVGKDVSVVAQLELDGTVLTTDHLDLYKSSNVATGILSATISAALPEGTHSISVRIIPDLAVEGSYKLTDTVYADYIATTLGLEIEGTVVSDGSTVLLKSEVQDIILKTTDSRDIITKVIYAGEQTEVNNNSMALGCHLKKSQRKTLSVTVATSSGSFSRTYTMTVVNPNTEDGVVFSFAAEDGKVYSPKLVNGEYYVSLPIDSTGGQLLAKTEDTNAMFTYAGNKLVNSNEVRQPVILSAGSDVDLKFTVMAEDMTTSTEYSVHVSNRNVKPEITIANKESVNNRIYGVNGYRSGKTFTDYSEDNAGVIIEVSVTDTNFNQYLKGSMSYANKTYPIHWNAITGPETSSAGKDKHGYIFIPNTDLKTDSDMSKYTIEVEDFEDVGGFPLSNSKTSVKFGVTVEPSNFSLTYDSKKQILQVRTDDKFASFSYTILAENGTIQSGKLSGYSAEIALTAKDRCYVTMIDSMGYELVKEVTV